MATTKNTQYWEEHKPASPLCLCYSQDKGLYTKKLSENEEPDELLYRPQGKVGFVNDKFAIPEQDVEIEIQTNFGYRGASYHRATFKKGDLYILDFDLSKLNILKNCSITTFDVSLYDWDGLFYKLVNAYNKSSIEAYTTSSVAYLEGLSKMLDKNKVILKGNIEDQNSIQWEGDFLVALYVGKKMRDLLSGFKFANTSDTVVIEQALNLCRKYICKVKSLVPDYSDSRVSQISDTLMLIHQFMCENKFGIDYLSMILDKEV